MELREKKEELGRRICAVGRQLAQAGYVAAKMSTSGVVGAVADIISYVANPTGAYIFWFTLIEFVNGFLFGGVGQPRPVCGARSP